MHTHSAPQTWRLNGVRALAEGEKLEAERKKREADALRKQLQGGDASSSSSSSSASSSSSSASAGRSTARSRQAAEDVLLFSSDGTRLSAAMQSKTRAKAAAGAAPQLDVSGMDQVDLLSGASHAHTHTHTHTHTCHCHCHCH